MARASQIKKLSCPLVRASLVLLLALALAAIGACSDDDSGTKPRGAAELPELKLTDDTPNLLLTWLDDRGKGHTVVSIGEIPEAGREQVRIVTEKEGHGALFYVADLTKKKPDGTYAVSTMRRSAWERIMAERRAAYAAKHAPPPPPPPSHTAPPAESGTPARVLTAIVYGAHWCSPCHQAAKYLKKKGLKVIERDIEKHPKYRNEMNRKLRTAGRKTSTIPIIDVGGVIVVGFSSRGLDQAIARAKGGSHL